MQSLKEYPDIETWKSHNPFVALSSALRSEKAEKAFLDHHLLSSCSHSQKQSPQNFWMFRCWQPWQRSVCVAVRRCGVALWLPPIRFSHFHIQSAGLAPKITTCFATLESVPISTGKRTTIRRNVPLQVDKNMQSHFIFLTYIFAVTINTVEKQLSRKESCITLDVSTLFTMFAAKTASVQKWIPWILSVKKELLFSRRQRFVNGKNRTSTLSVGFALTALSYFLALCACVTLLVSSTGVPYSDLHRLSFSFPIMTNQTRPVTSILLLK